MNTLPKNTQNTIDRFEREKTKLSNKILVLKEIPNIQVSLGQWEFTSPDVNSIADKVEFTFEDTRGSLYACYAWPYIERHGIKIYCDGYLKVATSDDHGGQGLVPVNNWENELKSLGISDTVVPLIRTHLDNNKEPWDIDKED